MGAPCQELLLGNDTESMLLKIPSLKVQLKEKWNAIPAARLSGLAPTFHGGPIDLCEVNGVWSPTLQAAHQGAIPITASLTGSRGMVKPFGYGTLPPQEAKVEHSALDGLETADKKRLTNITDAKGNWREMDWNSNRRSLKKKRNTGKPNGISKMENISKEHRGEADQDTGAGNRRASRSETKRLSQSISPTSRIGPSTRSFTFWRCNQIFCYWLKRTETTQQACNKS